MSETGRLMHVEYASPLKGEAFRGYEQRRLRVPAGLWRTPLRLARGGHVAGEFSSDGRSVSGREEWNYATASGDELRLLLRVERDQAVIDFPAKNQLQKLGACASAAPAVGSASLPGL